MPGEDLHRESEHAQQTPPKRRPREYSVYGQKQQRRPDHGAKIGKMSGINVQKMRSAEHEHRCREKTGERAKAAVGNPEIRECAAQKNVQRNTPIDRSI